MTAIERSDGPDLTLRDEVAEVLAGHRWERAHYGDFSSPSAPIGKWGYRCPCGEFVKGQAAHREHLADALLPLLARVREEAMSERQEQVNRGIDAARRIGMAEGEARVRERVEAVLSDMEPGAIAPIVAIRAALAEPDGEGA